MGRRRRGRRRPWEEREGAGQPGQPRFGPDGYPAPAGPPRGPGSYGPPASGPARWQAGGGPAARRANTAGARVPAGRWFPEGQPVAPSRRWQSGQAGAPPGQHPRGRRFGRPPRPQRDACPEPERQEAPPVAAQGGPIDPFELFCAYHLGITAENGYRIQNIHEVARRFGTNAAALKQTLTAYGMDADDMVHSGFDLASAQIDIMVAPAGISRRELARPLFSEFRSAPRKARDWAKEMEAAEREIAETIGRDGPWSPSPRDRAGKQS